MSYPPPQNYYNSPPPGQQPYPGYGGAPAPSYPPNPNAAYPNPNPSYPPSNPSYPPSNPSYQPNAGYPPPNTGYGALPNPNPGYLSPNSGYPPQPSPSYPPQPTSTYPPQPSFPAPVASTPAYDPYATLSQPYPNGPGPANPSFPSYPPTNTAYPPTQQTPAFPPQPQTGYTPPPSIGAAFPQHSTSTPNYAPPTDGAPLYPPPKPQNQNPYGDDDGMGAAFPAAFDQPAPYNPLHPTNAGPGAAYPTGAPSTQQPLQPAYTNNTNYVQQGSSQHQNVPIAQRGPLWPTYIKPVHPSVLSMTCGAMPKDNALRMRANIPIAAVFRPLVDLAPGEPALPVINPGAVGVVRCKDCRGYINPFVRFMDGGSRWSCNLCGLANDVPSAYFSSIDSTGKRADIATGERPELTDAAIEIMAPMDYMVRPPMPPCFVFCLDVSLNSIRSGMLEVAAKTILSTLSSLPGDKRTLIGFVTFDSTVHFYQLKPGSAGPQMFVVSDLEDIFLPVPDDLLVNLDESRAAVTQLLESLPSMHSKTTDVESALGPALEGALQLMGRIGGKMQVFLSGLPSLGIGRLSNRDNPRLLGTEKESSVLMAANDYYKRLAVKFTKYQICVDLFLFADQYIDVATLSDVSKLTGGQTLYYPFFNAAQHGMKLQVELSHTLLRSQGWEAVIRVRASKGVRIHDFHGNFFLRGTDLLALPGIDSDKSFAFEVRNEENISIGSSITIQSALLYTTSTGERRIRVHTISIPVTSLISDLFERINVNALCNLIAKQSIPIALGQSFEKARETMRNRCIAIMRTHRTQIMNKGGSPASVEALAALPLMTLGLIKNPAFRDGTDVRTDVRAAVLSDLTSMGIVELETFVRPRMLPIHELNGEIGLEEKTSGMISLPAEIGLSADVLRSDGVYLIDNGMEFIIRVGRQTSPTFLSEVFGIQTLDGLDTRTLTLQVPQPQDTLSTVRRLHNILEYLRKLSSHYQSVVIVVEGDAAEVRFFNLLIEDRNITAMSLVEFINHINRGSFSQQQ